MRFSLFAFISLAACHAAPEKPSSEGDWKSTEAPAPGTVVAERVMEHTTVDGLNTFRFRVKVTKAAARGVYNVLAQDGPNKGETRFTLPKGGEDYMVMLRQIDETTRMEIGFRAPGNTTIYPYYEVVAEGKTIRAGYTHAYRFE